MNDATPHWPRLMKEGMAAAYLSISASTLRTKGPAPKHIGRAAVWDIRDLDRFADSVDGMPLDQEQREAEGDDIDRRVEERLKSRASG